MKHDKDWIDMWAATLYFLLDHCWLVWIVQLRWKEFFWSFLWLNLDEFPLVLFILFSLNCYSYLKVEYCKFLVMQYDMIGGTGSARWDWCNWLMECWVNLQGGAYMQLRKWQLYKSVGLFYEGKTFIIKLSSEERRMAVKCLTN